ncbi:MAG: hypothetical protein ABIJ39_09225 [Chloroflexota bacterium]
MTESHQTQSLIKSAWKAVGWTRSSNVLLGLFLLTIFLIVYIWWPLAEQVIAFIDWNGPWWLYFDWLLVGIFFFMSLTIISRADLRVDALIIFVGTLGGLAIESWGTQTNLWFYYTAERPPLWIIPAWPIASLSIDRITRLLAWGASRLAGGNTRKRVETPTLQRVYRVFYWITFAIFLGMMVVFVAPTYDKPLTLLSLLLCILIILTPGDHHIALLTFLAGSGLGYYLELWGTTRQCWTYYTYQTPPIFAVLAHGMAAVVFWRAGLIVKTLVEKLRLRLFHKVPLFREPGD